MSRDDAALPFSTRTMPADGGRGIEDSLAYNAKFVLEAAELPHDQTGERVTAGLQEK